MKISGFLTANFIGICLKFYSKTIPCTERDAIILAITAYAMKGDEEKALAAGCDGYISKPININKILVVIDGFLHGKIQEQKVNLKYNSKKKHSWCAMFS